MHTIDNPNVSVWHACVLYVAGLFFTSWVGLSPFITFQALISARDDGQDAVSSGSAVAPLLVLLAWLCISALFFANRYRTAFQVS